MRMSFRLARTVLCPAYDLPAGYTTADMTAVMSGASAPTRALILADNP